MRSNAFILLRSYLKGRTQYVIYDGVQSATSPINCGVPYLKGLFLCRNSLFAQ